VTTVGIREQALVLDGRPTYAGRFFEGRPVEGLLFNVRAVQATFDDANPATRRFWAYPDTGIWDPQRNTDALCAALPSWRRHGVLALTVNWQGGGPLYVPEIYEAYDNNGFTRDGEVLPQYAQRMAQVLTCADACGMVVIVGLFYWVSLRRMAAPDAIWRAACNALDWLADTGHRNILVEVANEVDVIYDRTGLDMFRPSHVHETVARLKAHRPETLISTSGGGADVASGRGMPTNDLVAVSDYVLLHGNGTRPEQLEAAIRAVRALPAYRQRPVPVVINEDSPAVGNLDAAWRNYASWGYYDQGFEGQADDPYADYVSRPRRSAGPLSALNGFQTPPVNWEINTPFKHAFFDRVAQITGAA